jgi:succinylglutamate desuccinylase
MLKLTAEKLIFVLLLASFPIALLGKNSANKSNHLQTIFSPYVLAISELTGDPQLVSHGGRQIYIYRFPAKDIAGREISSPSHRLLIQSGLHGNEQLAVKFVNWLMEEYTRERSHLNQLTKRGVAIDFLPVANPDGTYINSRYNKNGVNLNRNFGTLWGNSREDPGPTKFSEPETRGIQALFKHAQYTSAVDVHGYINWIVAPSKLTAKSPQSKFYLPWVQALKAEMQGLPGYQFHTAHGLGDGGAFEDWAFWEGNALSYCLELKSAARYETIERPSFSNVALTNYHTADLFRQYENFIYRMFERAIQIKNINPFQQLANQATVSNRELELGDFVGN